MHVKWNAMIKVPKYLLWVWVHAKLLNTKLKIIIMLRGDEYIDAPAGHNYLSQHGLA